MEAVLDHGQFFEPLRQAKRLRELPGKEKGESVGLVLPKVVVLETLLRGIQQGLDLRFPYLLLLELKFNLAYQVLEANRALLDLGTRPRGRHE
ncbi:MAG: hypothetical protein M3461_07110 [Pseudomonadota bacterium]|nr:hypothetical protein [Pseudomonadota bacterium]